MFVDNPFWLAILVSAVIAAVLMLALWLGLDRAVARRIVLGAVIPAVAVAVPAAIGLPDTARGGIGAALLMLVLGGVFGAVLDFSKISERICLAVAGLLLLLGAWLVLAAPINGLAYHPTSIKVVAWLAYLLVGGCFLLVTRPDFSQDDIDDEPKGKKTKGRATKSAKTAKSAKASSSLGQDEIAGFAMPGPVAVLMTLSLGLGIIADQFGLQTFVVFQAALTVALFVALVSEKATPQYRATVWLAVVCALMASATGVMIVIPASCFAVAVLLLVVSAGPAAARISVVLPQDNPAQSAVLGAFIRIGVLGLPLAMAALVAYVGAMMRVTAY